MFQQLMTSYLQSLRAVAENGIDIVAEAVIIPERLELYEATFDGIVRLLVDVRCPLELAKQREAARTDRPHIELDHPWWFSVHEHEYDLEVDTSTLATMREGADRVVARFLEL